MAIIPDSLVFGICEIRGEGSVGEWGELGSPQTCLVVCGGADIW